MQIVITAAQDDVCIAVDCPTNHCLADDDVIESHNDYAAHSLGDIHPVEQTGTRRGHAKRSQVRSGSSPRLLAPVAFLLRRVTKRATRPSQKSVLTVAQIGSNPAALHTAQSTNTSEAIIESVPGLSVSDQAYARSNASAVSVLSTVASVTSSPVRPAATSPLPGSQAAEVDCSSAHAISTDTQHSQQRETATWVASDCEHVNTSLSGPLPADLPVHQPISLYSQPTTERSVGRRPWRTLRRRFTRAMSQLDRPEHIHDSADSARSRAATLPAQCSSTNTFGRLWRRATGRRASTSCNEEEEMEELSVEPPPYLRGALYPFAWSPTRITLSVSIPPSLSGTSTPGQHSGSGSPLGTPRGSLYFGSAAPMESTAEAVMLAADGRAYPILPISLGHRRPFRSAPVSGPLHRPPSFTAAAISTVVDSCLRSDSPAHNCGSSTVNLALCSTPLDAIDCLNALLQFSQALGRAILDLQESLVLWEQSVNVHSLARRTEMFAVMVVSTAEHLQLLTSAHTARQPDDPNLLYLLPSETRQSVLQADQLLLRGRAIEARALLKDTVDPLSGCVARVKKALLEHSAAHSD